MRPGAVPTEDAIRAAFAPAQAEILLAVLGRVKQPASSLSMKQAADRVGLSYHVFRKLPDFDAAVIPGTGTGQGPRSCGRRKRYKTATLDRIAENIRKTAS